MPTPTPAVENFKAVRRADEDRWLASRFAPPAERAALEAIYALNIEIANAAIAPSQPGLTDIRLAWWRDALASLFAGAAAHPHPALAAYAAVNPDRDAEDSWAKLIAARRWDGAQAPFEGWGDLQAYAEATAGGALRIAIGALIAPADRPKAWGQFCAKAGQAWAFVGLLRAQRHWAERGACFFPRTALEHAGLSPQEASERVEHGPVRALRLAMLDRARRAYAEASDAAPLLPARAFAAFGYLALTPAYARALAAPGSAADVAVPLLARQFTLLKSSLTGRL